MNSFITIMTKKEVALLTIILGAIIIYSWSTLTTKPRLFFDEGFFIEEAHNFSERAKLDIITAPHEYSGLPHIANSSGFSATLPLAGVFKVFGFGLEQARSYALFWMIAFLAVAYIFVRKHFGIVSAFQSVLLLATFPPFHSNGRMLMGDIAGFTYLLVALLLLPRAIFPAGVFLGLCVVSRPSVYAVALIGTLAYLVYSYRKEALKPLLKLIGGVSISVVLSILLYLPHSLTPSFWRDSLLFLAKPTFGVTSTFTENLLQ